MQVGEAGWAGQVVLEARRNLGNQGGKAWLCTALTFIYDFSQQDSEAKEKGRNAETRCCYRVSSCLAWEQGTLTGCFFHFPKISSWSSLP